MSGLETAATAKALIEVRAVTKTFGTPNGKVVPVLAGIDLTVADGEFVALLGRSGSGKSTLLRCIAGLIAPSSGEVLFRGNRLTGTNRGTAMVFQTFALLPWLSVQRNVEIGLEARGVDPADRARRALRAIDIVGLDGYESAYPKELSGGMRQRVGFARALVVEPDVLLMDEPFSALDVLTAENLRGELLELWEGRRFPTRAIVMVTHNIEEAVLLADRILVLGTNPGRIKEELVNHLERPRQRRTPDFDAMVDRIYGIMTERTAAPPEEPTVAAPAGRGTPGDTPLPHATVDGLSGLAEILFNRGGGSDLADLADALGLEVDDLLPLVDSLIMLGFAVLEADHLHLTPGGVEFASAGIQASKQMFARSALEHAPLVRTIDGALRGARDGNLPAGFFLDILRRSFSPAEAEGQLDAAVNWGRYAELYAFDAGRGQIIREDHAAHPGETVEMLPPPRGRLRVYLGAAPGAGTTYAMLREGRERRARGEDVVVGWVAPDQPPRTEEAIGDLERAESDVEALIARRPDVVLVDELAHSNPAGARHAKRWQDVEQLLEAGIDVIATVDIRHMESVKDLTGRITGRPARESLPDAVLDGADEVQFVDIGPEALRRRIRHGNVFPPDQVEAGLDRFRPEVVQALREIALRLVAESIGTHREEQRPEPQDVLVAVAGGPSTDALIRRASRLARRTGARCSVLYVVPPGGEADAETLAALSSTSQQVGASLLVRESRDPVRAIKEAARELVVKHLMIGEARPHGLIESRRGTITDRLVEELPDLDVHVLAHYPAPRSRAARAVPDPGDAGEEAAPTAARGTLRAYLGYARGVGATTSMLDEARRRRSRGTDVVVAVASLHGSAPSEEAMGDLEILGGDDGEGARGILDLDSLLARNPQVACVDDLAKSMPDGRRVAALVPLLLDAGITVIGTVRMADVEFTAGLLEAADEVELVDITPEALVERLRRGDILPADQVPAALDGEYRISSLAPLRDAAFKLVARLADRKLVEQMRGRGPDRQWETRPRILACVPPDPGMERLVRRAAELAGSMDADFRVAMVTTGRDGSVAAAYQALTQQLGGEFVSLEGGPAADLLAKYARENAVTEMVVGRRNPRRGRGRGTVRDLVRHVPDVDMHILPAEPA